MRPAVVCVGDAGINGLATVRSLGRRGVPVHVFSLKGSPEVASVSRYCRSHTAVEGPADLCTALLDFARPRGERPVLYVDNDAMMKLLAPHAGVLAARFELVDPIGEAERLTDKQFQRELARRSGIAVPRTWFPADWTELRAIRSAKRLIAKPRGRSVSKSSLRGAPPSLRMPCAAASPRPPRCWCRSSSKATTRRSTSRCATAREAAASASS